MLKQCMYLLLDPVLLSHSYTPVRYSKMTTNTKIEDNL